MSPLKWGYLVPPLVWMSQQCANHGEMVKEPTGGHGRKVRGAISGSLLQHGAFWGCSGLRRRFAKATATKLSGSVAGLAPVSYWLPSGVILLATCQMFQAGHYLVFKQTRFPKHKLLLFSTCISVYLVALDQSLTNRFLKTWLSKDADRSLSRMLKHHSLNRSWHPRRFESRCLSA